MPRDYKPRTAPRRRRKRQSPPGWLWLLAGLTIGLFIAFLFYLQQRPAKQPTVAAPTAPAPASQSLNVPAANPTVNQDARAVRKTETAKALPPPPKPRFDFYTILPEMEVPVPEQEITGQPREGVPQVEAPGTYLLQAGSFRTRQQADQLKAKLALLGLQSDIQTVTINNTETWHRVRVGPFSDLNALNTARARLKENQLDAILLRVGG
ncbi:MAG: SPOR domain-containing protein [Gammaproteobacteria bacterium]|nr:SPOR domain-containing protein [Gammaproteobacteria bacterium]